MSTPTTKTTIAALRKDPRVDSIEREEKLEGGTQWCVFLADGLVDGSGYGNFFADNAEEIAEELEDTEPGTPC